MSLYYKQLPRLQEQVSALVGATCDACGKDAYDSLHHKPHATLSRVKDYGGAYTTWDLDLCMDCRSRVVNFMRNIAADNHRELPDYRRQTYEGPSS